MTEGMVPRGTAFGRGPFEAVRQDPWNAPRNVGFLPQASPCQIFLACLLAGDAAGTRGHLCQLQLRQLQLRLTARLGRPTAPSPPAPHLRGNDTSGTPGR